MSSRKRRRSQAFKEDEMHEIMARQEEEEEEEEIAPANGELNGDGEEPVEDQDQAEKEREVWDVVREERYEIVEQLPLTLHRQLSLMRQLDEQSQSYVKTLLPMVEEYISLRKSLASPPEAPANPTTDDAASTSAEAAPTETANGTSAQAATLMPTPTPIPNILLQPPNATAPMPIPIERTRKPRTSREYLSHIAWLSEEVLRASQEKVNLAQATYDSAERHIRLLDLAIREQEVALTSTEGSIQLPDLTLPASGRASQNATSPDKIIDSFNAIAAHSAKRINDYHFLEKKKNNQGQPEDGEEGDGEYGEYGPNGDEVAIDWGDSVLERELFKDVADNLIKFKKFNESGEELYCYCNRVSFGEMIACDNSKCKLEWFHLGCVGLREPPEGEWYCENCTKFDA